MRLEGDNMANESTLTPGAASAKCTSCDGSGKVPNTAKPENLVIAPAPFMFCPACSGWGDVSNKAKTVDQPKESADGI